MKDHGWVYEDEGVWVYRASVFGSCLRSLVSARLGESAFPFNASIQAAMDASSGLEDVILNRIIAELGGTLIWQQKEVELAVGQMSRVDAVRMNINPDDLPEGVVNAVVRGHIDALRQDDDSIIEAKALGPTNFAKYNSGGLDALGNLGKKYRWQGAIYGHATGRKVRFVIGEKVKIATPHGDGSFDWGIGELIIEPPVDPQSLVPLEEIVARVQEVERYAAEDVLPECTDGCREGDPYSECHIFPSAERGDDQLLTLLTRYDELREQIGAEPKDGKPGWGLLGEFANLKDDIKEQYGDPSTTKKYALGPFSVSIRNNKGKEFIDGNWLKKNYPDIAASATKFGKPYQVLTVKGTRQERDESGTEG